MSDLRVALLGTGFITELRMQVYQSLQGVEVVSLLGRNRDRCEEIASQFGIAHTATTYEEILEGPQFDVVDICLPNYLHRDYAILAAESGKHIICEKPLAVNASQAQEMLEAAEKAGVIHCYAENWVFSPDMKEVEDTIRRGIIGKPLWMRGREGHFGPHSRWFYEKQYSGGGALIDMGCHVIGAFNKFVDSTAEAVFCHAPTLYHETDSDDNAIAIVRYSGGLVGQVEASWTVSGGMAVSFEIWGEEGLISYDRSGLAQPIRVFSKKQTDKYFMEKAESDRGWLFPVVEEFRKYGYYDEITHFMDCINNGRKPEQTFEDGLVVNRIIDAAYASSKSGKWESGS